jgi:CheY-like chemotaxis protein
MLRILLCSPTDMRAELAGSVIGRQGIELYRATEMKDIRLLVSTLGCQLILVDQDVPDLPAFLGQLRQDEATRSRSVAVVTRGGFRADDLELLQSGANAILRLPPDETWTERLSRLLTVPVRQEARIPVHFAVSFMPEQPGFAVNLSSGGMLLATAAPLAMHQEIDFRFELPDGSRVKGQGRVVRQAAAGSYGVEFTDVPDDDRTAIRQYLRTAHLG